MLPERRLTMIIPSMGRPAAAREAAMSAIEHATLPTTTVIVAVDGPHPADQLDAYMAIGSLGAAVMMPDHHRGMVGTLNTCAASQVETETAREHLDRARDAIDCGMVTHVGFMGDDHRVRTRGWDDTLTRAAGHFGIAYGDDLLRGPELPTAVVIGADTVRTLGHMGPDVLGHMYIDDYWRELGIGIGALSYRSDVVIEHLHPSAGKAEIDESYERTNHPDQYARDAEAWARYQRGGLLRRDVSAVRWQMHLLAWRGVVTIPN